MGKSKALLPSRTGRVHNNNLRQSLHEGIDSMETTMMSRRMAMVETSNDRNGVVVHRSISQRSRVSQDPRSEQLSVLVVLASSILE